MEILKPEGHLGSFFERLSSTKNRALLLDYDGTLAPFHIQRDKAIPYPGIRDVLNKIIAETNTHLAIISGRWTKDLLPLLKLKSLPEIWGSHGVERLQTNGKYQIGSLDKRYANGLIEARSWMEQEGFFHLCEWKPASLALHWRGKNEFTIENLRSKIGEKWQQIASRSGLSLHQFDGGLELRGHANKGIAVDTIFSEMGDDTVMAYLGDDQTDEDAFRAVGDRGLSVLVRPELRPTIAHLWITPPDQLLEFLDRWLKTDKER